MKTLETAKLLIDQRGREECNNEGVAFKRKTTKQIIDIRTTTFTDQLYFDWLKLC